MPDDDIQAVQELNQAYQTITAQLAKVIVGQQQVIEELLIALFARGHCLLVGVPGLAKTLMIRTLARALELEFRRIQFTPDLMPSDITGTEVIQEDKATGARQLRFLKGPIFANVILADEINRTPPKTQAALLEAMQEYQVTSLGVAHPLPKPFIVFATQNPIEQEGTYPLPEAQLDRFLFSLWMDYPSAEEEEQIVLETTDASTRTARTVCQLEEMTAFQQLVRHVPASRHIVRYAVSLARATRPNTDVSMKFINDYVSWGAGPRASQHMILGAKALAVLDGQPAVTAAHIREIAPLVLRHRVMPNYNAVGEGLHAADLVRKVIETVREPWSVA